MLRDTPEAEAFLARTRGAWGDEIADECRRIINDKKSRVFLADNVLEKALEKLDPNNTSQKQWESFFKIRFDTALC
ncbi:MAG: hypothetical protein V4519_04770 [Patescibacteria group bacterium]